MAAHNSIVMRTRGAHIMCDTKSHPLSGAVKGSTQARVHCLVPPRTGVAGNSGVRERERKAEGAGSHPLTPARDKPDGRQTGTPYEAPSRSLTG